MALYEKSKFDAMSGAADKTARIITKASDELTKNLPNAPSKFRKQLARNPKQLALFETAVKELKWFVDDIKAMKP